MDGAAATDAVRDADVAVVLVLIYAAERASNCHQGHQNPRDACSNHLRVRPPLLRDRRTCQRLPKRRVVLGPKAAVEIPLLARPRRVRIPADRRRRWRSHGRIVVCWAGDIQQLPKGSFRSRTISCSAKSRAQHRGSLIASAIRSRQRHQQPAPKTALGHSGTDTPTRGEWHRSSEALPCRKLNAAVTSSSPGRRASGGVGQASTRLQGRQTGGTVARAAHSGGRRLGFRIPPERTSERADSGSCSAATGGRGEAGHPAQDPRCPPGHHLHGAVRAAHRGPRAGGGR